MTLPVEQMLWEQYAQAVRAWHADPNELNEKAMRATWYQFYQVFVADDYSGVRVH